MSTKNWKLAFLVVGLCFLNALLVGSVFAQEAENAQGIDQEKKLVPKSKEVETERKQSGIVPPLWQSGQERPLSSFLRLVTSDTNSRLFRLGDLSETPRVTRPRLLGDLAPLGIMVNDPVAGPFYVPSVRSFKMGDMQSPQPQNGFYYGFNTFQNLYRPINRSLGGNVTDIQVSRNTIGIERTVLDEYTSVSLVLPFYSASARSATVADLNGSRGTVGDLTVILKRAFWESEYRDAMASMGIAVTAPTGPDNLFGSSRVPSLHDTTLQPFVGFLATKDRWYVQGFVSLDVPTNSDNVTLLFTDLGVRYALYQDERARILQSITPTAEIHVVTPLNHQGIRITDPAGSPDQVNVTAGVEFVLLNGRLHALFGVVTPLVGPRIMDFEVLSQVKFKY